MSDLEPLTYQLLPVGSLYDWQRFGFDASIICCEFSHFHFWYRNCSINSQLMIQLFGGGILVTRSRNTCLALLTVLASPMAAADLIWDFRFFGANGQLTTNDGVDHNYEILAFETQSSSHRNVPVANWTILSGGNFGFDFEPAIADLGMGLFSWGALELEAPMYIDTVLYGSTVLLPVTQRVGFSQNPNRRAAWPNSEPGAIVSFGDNSMRNWADCADEWAAQIERGHGPNSCLENGSYGGPVAIYPNYFRFELDLNPVSVPEPGVLALFGIGLAAMGLLRRRRIEIATTCINATDKSFVTRLWQIRDKANSGGQAKI